MTRTELDALRDSLLPFPGGTASGELLARYLGYYGLDFSGAHPGVEHHCGTVSSGPFVLATHRWTLPGARASLVLVHGYFDHTGIFDKLIEFGLSRGCNVVIFDLPGHGLSSGETALIEDFAQYGEAVASVVSRAVPADLPVYAIAQSTGCAALVELARRHPWPFDKAVFLAPLVRPAGWLGVRLGHSLLHRFTDSLERKFNENSSDREFLAFVQREPLQSRRMPLGWIGALRRWLKGLPLEDLGVGPVLVLQGDRDGTVGWKYNMKAVARLFPESRIEYLPGAGHQLANESGTIRADYGARIDAYLFPEQRAS